MMSQYNLNPTCSHCLYFVSFHYIYVNIFIEIQFIKHLQQYIYAFIEYTYRNIFYKKIKVILIIPFCILLFQLDIGKYWDKVKANLSSDRNATIANWSEIVIKCHKLKQLRHNLFKPHFFSPLHRLGNDLFAIITRPSTVCMVLLYAQQDRGIGQEGRKHRSYDQTI